MPIKEWLNNLRRRLSFQWRYLGTPPWDTGVTPPEVYAFIQSHPPGRALDLGCGTGTNAISLAKAGWDVIGVDFVGSAIAQGRIKARQVGVEVDFRLGEVTQLEDIQGPFDLVLDIGCYHSLDPGEKNRYVKQLEDLLAKQGYFLMYAFVNNHEQAQIGLTFTDLVLLGNSLECVARVDGTDLRERQSAWFTYRLKK